VELKDKLSSMLLTRTL